MPNGAGAYSERLSRQRRVEAYVVCEVLKWFVSLRPGMKTVGVGFLVARPGRIVFKMAASIASISAIAAAVSPVAIVAEPAISWPRIKLTRDGALQVLETLAGRSTGCAKNRRAARRVIGDTIPREGPYTLETIYNSLHALHMPNISLVEWDYLDKKIYEARARPNGGLCSGARRRAKASPRLLSVAIRPETAHEGAANR